MITKLRRYLSFSSDPLPSGGEGPRGFVGGLWHELGELQFRFLVDHGLRPDHVLLDIACGSLRAGVRLIPYLQSGNYLGIDINRSLIEHGKKIELGPTMCEVKLPEFVISEAFEFGKFSKQPDFCIAQSLFTHLTDKDIALCLGNLREYGKNDTVLYATFFEVDAPIINPAQSHPQAPFRYTRSEMELVGRQAGWSMEYIGEWSHPRSQNMLRYTPT
jgi:hypothetical protein